MDYQNGKDMAPAFEMAAGYTGRWNLFLPFIRKDELMFFNIKISNRKAAS